MFGNGQARCHQDEQQGRMKKRKKNTRDCVLLEVKTIANRIDAKIYKTLKKDLRRACNPFNIV